MPRTERLCLSDHMCQIYFDPIVDSSLHQDGVYDPNKYLDYNFIISNSCLDLCVRLCACVKYGNYESRTSLEECDGRVFVIS